MTKQTSKTVPGTSAKKSWAKPQLRSVVPASHTRSGAYTGGPQEDATYRIS